MMNDCPYMPIMEITRGKVVESIHFGSIAVVDHRGRLIASYGNPNTVTYLRSSAKPFQALPFLEQGGKETYDLTLREVALLCASHSGTDEHVQVVESIQAKTGVQEKDLMCGVHAPSHAETAEALRQRGEKPTPNRHNCSGKHSGMLAYARLKGPAGKGYSSPDESLPYIDPAHSIQKDILQAFAEMCEIPVERVAVGIDGCSAPNFAVPLWNAALALAKLCDPGRLDSSRARACRTITTAMTSHPDMIGGPDSFDTHLMETTSGRMICKGGAEGYQALGLLPGALGPSSPALGIAIKISDGDLAGRAHSRTGPGGRVRPAVTLEILRRLGAISDTELEKLAEYGPTFHIRNWRKLVVGEARPCFELHRED